VESKPEKAASRKYRACASTTIPINSPDKAFLRGIELSWQTHFWYLPGLLSGLVLDVNCSFLNSSAQYPYFLTVATDTTKTGVVHTKQHYRTRSGQLVDQPNSMFNVIVGWDYKDFSSRVSFRYQGKTLTSLDAKYSLQDSYYDDVFLVDVSLQQKLLYNFAVYANLTNINKHIDDYYYTSSSGNLPTSSQTYGMRIQLGLSYHL
jgi:hypothetical protein